MRTSDVSIRLTGYWDDFKRGIKWQHEERIALKPYVIWILVDILYVFLIATASAPLLRWFNITLALVVNIIFVVSTIKSGRHAKHMENLRAETRELFDMLFTYIMPPLDNPFQNFTMEQLKEEDVPDEDF